MPEPSPPRKRRHEVLAEFRQGEILAAARRVFARRGFEAATLDEIAAAAGLAKGTLYLYFDSKETIFWEALRECLETLRQRARRAMDAAPDVRGRLRAAVVVRCELMRNDAEFMRIYLTEFGHLCAHPTRYRKNFRDFYLDLARDLAVVIEQGVREGALRPVPPLETALMLALMVRDFFTSRFLGLFDDQTEPEQFIFDLFWRGVHGETIAPASGTL